MAARDALNKYLTRQLKNDKNARQKRTKKTKNASPEKAVVKEIIGWCEKVGFSVSVVESKAVYSKGAGRYIRGQTEAGFSDIAGVAPNGRGCFIEVKAKGKLSTLKIHQAEFLETKIRLGAFGCCVDSVDLVADIYRTWLAYLIDDEAKAKQFLIDSLPVKSSDIEEKFMTDEEIENEFPW